MEYKAYWKIKLMALQEEILAAKQQLLSLKELQITDPFNPSQTTLIRLSETDLLTLCLLSLAASGGTSSGESSVVVSNFPTTQAVSGTVAVSNSFTLDATSQAIRDRLPSTLENGALRISNNLAPSAGISGTKTVAAANAWEVLTAATVLRSGIEVQAGTTNTGLVFVRYVGSTDGIALTAGNSRFIPINNTDRIEVSVGVAGDRIRWMGS